MNKLILCSRIIGVSVVFTFLATISPAQAVPVGIELLLLADVSDSVSPTDFELQRDGYAAAFQNTEVQNLITNTSGGIAVSFVYWATGQDQVVPWTHVTDVASANAFAASIAAASRPSWTPANRTSMTAALTFGTGLFAGNNFESNRLIIDISGDGAESTECGTHSINCAPLQAARDGALAVDISINALWIEDKVYPSGKKPFCRDPDCWINPLEYGNNNVIGGTDAFQLIVASFGGFEDAVVDKIKKEINPNVPEPTTLALMGLGLAGIGYRRHRSKKTA